MTVALAGFFGWGMIGFLRPRLVKYGGAELTPAVFSAVLAAVFVSSFLTSTIGVHEIFGAFVLGLIFPRGELAERVRDRVGTVTLILLPVFFVTTGLNVDISGIGIEGSCQLVAIISVAFVGKLGGAFLGARTQGLDVRDAIGVGALMNTRGLAELVVLNIGRELGVIDGQLFTLLVIMAVVTTVATGPLLDLIKPDPDLGRAIDAAEGSS